MQDRPPPQAADDSGHSRPNSGPPDVPIDWLLAARRGDPAAFARVIEHWDEHLRPFVHLTLSRPASTDKVLHATYLAAYRALPRYKASHTPGLWLHRIAYRSVVDEIRRQGRDPERRRRPEPRSPAKPDPLDRLRHLHADQRAIATMVDLEGFLPAAVARLFAIPESTVQDRLRTARLVLTGDPRTDKGPARAHRHADPAGVLIDPMVPSGAERPPPGAPTRRDGAGTDPGDPFAVPAWMDEESAEMVAGSRPAEAEPEDDSADAAVPPVLAPAATAVLAAIPIDAAGFSFWPDLGRLLLAERARPAALPSDPAARLARSNRSDPPATHARTPDSIATIADRADRTRPRRRWGRGVAVVGVAMLVVAAVVVAVWIGVSDRVPDGTNAAPETAVALASVLDSSKYLAVDAVVERPDEDESEPEQAFRVTIADDGSWVANRTDAIDRSTYLAPFALTRRVVAVPAEGSEQPLVLADERAGLAPGRPDPNADRPEPIETLATIGPLLRSATEGRMTPGTEDGVAIETFRTTVATSAIGGPEEWTVVLRADDALPSRVERRVGDRLVSRVSYENWQPLSEVPEGTFVQAIPPGAVQTSSDFGFAPVDLDVTTLLGRGLAVTPSWLPTGFDIGSVAIRGAAPAGEPSTAEGANPPDLDVSSVSYWRGPERITVTTRLVGPQPSDWKDPFGVEPQSTVAVRTLGDGRFNQADIEVVVAPGGRTHIWGRADDVIFTVGGDLTEAEATRVANSLR